MFLLVRSYVVGLLAVLVSVCGMAFPATAAEEPLKLLQQSPRVVFLGDSITFAGEYVADFEAWLLTRKDVPAPTVINVGLPSETVSGLSEDGHAGGQFPRPHLQERLQRVLDATRPNLVIACYGINCGIYLPFDEERLARYQAGMQELKAAVERTGATFVVMTPPFYDGSRGPKLEYYNAVLDRYSAWLLSQREAGWRVIDLHGPMTKYVTTQQQADPAFTLQPDAVHPNAAGQWFVAQQLIAWFGDAAAAKAPNSAAMLAAAGLPEPVLPLLRKRMSLRRDAYLSAARHLRPGIAAGLPVPEAEREADKLTVELQKLLD